MKISHSTKDNPIFDTEVTVPAIIEEVTLQPPHDPNDGSREVVVVFRTAASYFKATINLLDWINASNRFLDWNGGTPRK